MASITCSGAHLNNQPKIDLGNAPYFVTIRKKGPVDWYPSSQKLSKGCILPDATVPVVRRRRATVGDEVRTASGERRYLESGRWRWIKELRSSIGVCGSCQRRSGKCMLCRWPPNGARVTIIVAHVLIDNGGPRSWVTIKDRYLWCLGFRCSSRQRCQLAGSPSKALAIAGAPTGGSFKRPEFFDQQGDAVGVSKDGDRVPVVGV